MATIERKPTRRRGRRRTKRPAFVPLPHDQLEYISSWGGVGGGMSYVARPSTIEGLQETFQQARKTGRTVGLRGGGNSYGDAALNNEQILLDLRRMNRILAWDPQTGIIQVEPGVTLQQVWRYVLEDGWWPPVCTGTMFTTMGGCAAMNVHGKNAWQLGPIGDHILTFDLMLPSGDIISCNRDENSDVFHAAIGGAGMLGCFTTITLQMKRIYAGQLRVTALAAANLHENLALFDQYLPESDYAVGWIDAFAKGKKLGRGELHFASYLTAEEATNPTQSLRLDKQDLPDTFFYMLPKSLMWMFMRPFWNRWGMPWVNRVKYVAAQRSHGHRYLQHHAAFHFLLDYIPNWKKAYGPTGLIQYQVFIPYANAEPALREILTLGQRYHQPNFLSVLKRHRPDPFLFTHGLDGYSLAMDFRITAQNQQTVVQLAREMDEVVLQANGRFYFAKDSTLRPQVAQAYLGTEAIKKFNQLRQQCDPENLLQTNLWRRLFTK